MTTQFTHITLGSWRNFMKVDLALGERVFIVGPNASGKSNLLDAFRFLREIATPGGSLVRAVENRQGLGHLRSLHARGKKSRVVVEVEMRVDDDPTRWSYRIEFSGSVRRNVPLRIELERVLHGTTMVLNRVGEDDSEDTRLLTQTHLEQASQNSKFRPLVDALASTLHVHISPQVARAADRTEEFSRRDAPGSDFVDQLARLSASKRTAALSRIQRLLTIAVPQFKGLRVERDDLGRPHIEAQYIHWRPDAGWQTEQDFSDGTLRLIGMLWAIDQGDAPLILEEPELSLHRDVIRQLPRLFADAAARRGRQVIVSTNTGDMLRDKGIAPSEIVLLEPTNEGTKAMLGSARRELMAAALAGIPLGDLVLGMTKPTHIEQLSLAYSGGKRS